jgi:hypothetical protein
MFREKTELDAWAAVPFASNAERLRAYADSEYRNGNNEAYRQAVYAKEALTEGGVIGASYNDTQTIHAELAPQDSEVKTAQESDLRSVEQQMKDRYGANSVAPAKAATIVQKDTAPISQWWGTR